MSWSTFLKRIREGAARLAARFFVWPRHWLSWVVGVLMTAAMVLIVVPGTPSTWRTHHGQPTPELLRGTMTLPDGKPMLGGSWGGPMPPWPHYVTHFRHGWPLTHAVSAVGSGGEGGPRPPRSSSFEGLTLPGGWPISWGRREAWLWSSDAARWWPIALVVNAATAAILIGLATLATEKWVRARGGLLRWRLVDFLTTIALVACFLGWRQWHLHQQSLEQQAHAMMMQYKPRPMGIAAGSNKDFAPKFLSRLFGSPQLTPWCLHDDHLELYPLQMTKEDWLLIEQLAYLEACTFHGLPTEESLRNLSRLHNVKRLYVRSDWGVAKSDLTDEILNLQSLSEMPKLETLQISCPHILVEDLEPLRRSPSLRRVELCHASVTPNEAEDYRRRFSPRFELLAAPVASNGWNPLDPKASEPVHVWESVTRHVARWRAKGAVGSPPDRFDDQDELDLRGVELTEKRVEQLRPVLGSLIHLYVDNASSEEFVARILSECKNLEDFRGNDLVVSDRIFSGLLQNRRLTDLSLRQGSASLDGLQRLVALPRLDELEVFSATLSRKEVAEL